LKPKLITEKEMPMIEGVLTSWSGKLTWPKFADAVARRLGRNSISTFTLMGDEGVKQAFKRRKETLKEAKANAVSDIGDVTIDALIRENEALRNQTAHLKSEHQIKEKLFKETFIRWQYNLSLMPRVDLSRLDAPLPRTDRDG
jgi:hypothetical protein